MSKIYTLKTIQNIPATLDEVWNFISSPDNLKNITPKHMGFEIISEHAFEKIYAGMIIKYKISPVLGIKLNWVTEITHVNEKNYFIDEQRFGPYSFWHHQHFIKAIENGVEMTDIVHYKIPFGFIGDIANNIIVKSQLKQIFDFRYKKLEQIFGKYSQGK